MLTKTLLATTLFRLLMQCIPVTPGSSALAALNEAALPAQEKMAAVDAWTAVGRLTPGINIGNTLDSTSHWETGWGNPPITREYVQSLAHLGFRTVRLPVAWDTYAENGRITPKQFQRVAEVVNWINDAGMYCVLNIHWDGGWIDSDVKERFPNTYHTFSPEAEIKFRSYWEQISRFFAGKNERLIFEAFNEETNFSNEGSMEKAYATLTRVNQLFIDTVRRTGGNNANRLLIVPGYSTDIDKTCKPDYRLPKDTVPGKLFISVHYYTPWQFVGLNEDASWGKMMPTWGSADDVKQLNELFDRLNDFCVRNDTPAFIGEFSVCSNKEAGSRVRWTSSVLTAAVKRKMVPVLWDTGGAVSRVAPYAPTHELSEMLRNMAAGPATQGVGTRRIDVDVNRVKGSLNRAFRSSVGSDRAIIHLRPEHQRDLRFLKETCGFEYLRFHGLLNEEMQVVKTGAKGEIVYDWTNIDRVYDFLVRDLKIRPIVELGFMPEPLASGKQTIFWWKGNVTAPKSYEQWGQFIEQLTRHLTERYGAEDVRKWYFEVWNEPNLDGFWPAGQAEYFKLYERSARAIKRVDKAYRVGGPATAGFGWIKETLNYCAQHDVPIDFIATHAYGAMEGFLDEKGKGHTMLAPSPDSVIDGLPGVLGAIRASKWPKLPVLVTEWGPSYSPRDPVHDSYFCAAWILHRLRRLPNDVVAMSYWTFSDQFEEAGIPDKPFHGGFGLLTMQGLPKPAYFAYRFLNQLGDTELACEDANVWACRDQRGGVQVLLWDYSHPHQDLPNSQFFKRDWPARPSATLHLNVANLAPGAHIMNITRVGYGHNDVYARYLGLGSPAGQPDKPWLLSDDVLAKLRASCTGSPETRKVTLAQRGLLSVDLPLNENDVYFITVEP